MSFAAIADSVSFGEALRRARREQGLSQAALAEKAGCSQRFVSELERGKATAELGKALQLMQTLGLSLQIRSANPAGEGRAAVERLVARVEAQLAAEPAERRSLKDYLGGAR